MSGSRERIVEVERFGELRLHLGGKHGYERVRGGQGPGKNQYQGYTKGKEHTTKLYDSAQEAAIALATLEQDIFLGLMSTEGKKPRAKRGFRTCGKSSLVCARLHLSCILLMLIIFRVLYGSGCQAGRVAHADQAAQGQHTTAAPRLLQRAADSCRFQ